MTKALAKELARDKIRVNCVALTFTSDTPTWDKLFAGGGFQQRPVFKSSRNGPWFPREGHDHRASGVTPPSVIFCAGVRGGPDFVPGGG